MPFLYWEMKKSRWLAPLSNAYTHILKPKIDICESNNETSDHAYKTTMQSKKSYIMW